MNSIDRNVYAAVAMTLEQLADDEAIAFHLFVELDYKNPETNLAWPKVEPLFTQELSSGGVGMHEMTKAAALAYLRQRCESL